MDYKIACLLMILFVVPSCLSCWTNRRYSRPYFFDVMCEEGRPKPFYLDIQRAVRLRPTRVGKNRRPYPSNLTCTVILQNAGGATSIGLHIRKFDLPKNCDLNHVILYNGTKEPMIRLCGSLNSTFYTTNYVSSFPKMQLNFSSGPNAAPRSTFDFITTAFERSDCNGGFLCRNKQCISGDLVCDKFDNCGDNSDEDTVDCSSVCTNWCGIGSAVVAAVGTVAVGVLLLTSVCCIVYFICKAKGRDLRDFFENHDETEPIVVMRKKKPKKDNQFGARKSRADPVVPN